MEQPGSNGSGTGVAAAAGAALWSGDTERLRHDLEAPLAAIAGFSELLRWEAAGTLNERQQKYVDCIAEAAGRLRQVLAAALPPVDR